MKRWIWILPVVLGASLLAAQDRAAQGQAFSRQVEWPYYGGDPGGTQLLAADRHRRRQRPAAAASRGSGSTGRRRSRNTAPRRASSKRTPLMIDGVLYVTTPYNSIAALDAETGKELWRFDGASLQARSAAVGQRVEAARHGVLARRRQAAPLPEQPASPVLARCADRQAR